MKKLVDLLHDPSPAERAIASAVDRAVAIPIREVMDPATTPIPFLPFVASHNSVDLWFDDWPEERKRAMIAIAKRLAAIKGTRAAFAMILPFVDAEIIERVTHPRRFVIGRSAIGLQPIGHRPFTSHLLVKVPLDRPPNGFVIGRSAIGRGALRTPNREPLRRLAQALVVAKSPETLVSYNTGHRRPVTLDDGFPLDGSFRFGGYLDRKRL